MPNGKVQIGPDVPEHIQRIRDERKRHLRQIVSEKTDAQLPLEAPDEKNEPGSSDDDDEYGPQIDRVNPENEETAMERLKMREKIDRTESSGADWLAIALGQKGDTKTSSRVAHRFEASKQPIEQVEPEDESEKGPSLLEQHRISKSKSNSSEARPLSRRAQEAILKSDLSNFTPASRK